VNTTFREALIGSGDTELKRIAVSVGEIRDVDIILVREFGKVDPLKRIHVDVKITLRRILTSILIHVQQDATLRSLFYLETALHVSDGTTAHHPEYQHLYLQHLVFVTPLLLSAAIVEELELV
jgi:hypothetical protein